jgi:hypothetical protein
MKKWRLLLGAGVFVLVALVIVWTTSVDYALERAIEQYGSEALGVPVRVGSVTIWATQGKGTIRGLQIGQPDGFGSGDAAAFEEITLDLDIESLISGNPYRIELARVAAPQVAYVVAADGTSNLKALQRNLERYSASGETSKAPDGEPSDLRLRIDRLEIERGRIDADLGRVGLSRSTANLPAMHFRDLGGAKGAPPGQIASQVGMRFLAQTLTTVANSAIGSSLDQVLKQGTKTVRGLLDKLRLP